MTYNTENIITFIDKFFKIKDKENSNVQNKEYTNNLNIKGQWGSGKTTYIQKLEKELEEKEYQVKIFNVWEYEISDNIFVSVLCDILRFFNYKPKNKFALKKFVKSLITVSGEYAINFASYYLKIESPLKYIKKIIHKSKDKEDNLLQFNNYNEAINEIIRQINLYTQYSKNIFIFDELDRCTTPKMIEFLSIIKNILFRLNNCFFIVSCDSDRINKMLIQNENNNNEIQNENNNNESYTDKIFYNTINIENLNYFDEAIICTNNVMIKSHLLKFILINDLKNDYRKVNKAINRANNFILSFKNNDNNFNWELFEFIAFWIYYKNINLLKINGNLSDLNLYLLFRKFNNSTKNNFFEKNKDSTKKEANELFEIVNIDRNCFIRVYNEKNISIPFGLFAPFIKDINNFDFENLCNITDIEDPDKYLSNKKKYLGDYLEYKNIYKYLDKDGQELFDKIFSYCYYRKWIYIELDIRTKKYFEYMQNII
ncbi:P-loop NTPase fold protein [Spiroplasma phoeniceum]|uniref:KAP NTPase domain-containing protein n=1 Tax=Spiroplasma phoeniceum P40 TaxID=1276259 RepID=A0A345DLM9_9MOLU|nr:P-loop NTPase fold protein [Spiroplasma phoeniceum]AXF95117.1 hypothetical protein SDAV_00101 [Spiroplasma phoeniceum P40]